MQNSTIVPRPHGCEGPIWEVMISDPGACILVLSHSGELLWINPQADLAFPVLPSDVKEPNPSPPDSVSRSKLETRLPLAIASDLKTSISHVANSGSPLRFRLIWNAKQLVAWIHPVEHSADPSVLVSIRHQGGDLDVSDAEPLEGVRIAATNHMGELDVLTRRELQVLAMIGQGLSIKRIAFELKRSEKTVENHRRAIGQKLNARDRVQLACLAYEAGLTVDDAQRDRVPVRHRDGRSS